MSRHDKIVRGSCLQFPRRIRDYNTTDLRGAVESMNKKYAFPVYDMTPIDDADGAVLFPGLKDFLRFKIRFKIRLL